MNTHDIELPPLSKSGWALNHENVFTANDMKAYARAAIEADRKRRGEHQGPFGYIQPLPYGGADSDDYVTGWNDCCFRIAQEGKRRGEPVAWRVHPFDYGIGHEGVYALTSRPDQVAAWERKGWEVQPLYTAPQPAEPVKVPSDADILDLWTGDPTHSRPVMGKNKVIAFARALLARYTTTKEQP